MAWNYSNTSIQTTLAGGINNVTTSIVVAAVSGFPVSFPYTLTLDFNQPTAEVVTVTAAVSTTLTVTRGQDGTSAQAHSSGAPVAHTVVARDLSEPQVHIAATTNVHGIGGASAVVGTIAAQTLTNKGIDCSSNTVTNIPGSAIVGNVNAAQVNGTFDGLQVVTSGSTYIPFSVSDGSASRTANLLDVRNTVSGKGLIVGDDEVVTVDDTDLVVDTRRALASPAPPSRIFAMTNGKPAIIADRPLAGTSNLQEWRANGAAVATMDYQGRLTTVGLTLGTVDPAAAWIAYTPTWAASAGSVSIGNGTLTGRYRLIGKTVDFTFKLTAGSTTTYGTAGAFWTIGLPPVGNALVDYVFPMRMLDLGTLEYTGYACVGAGLAVLEFFKSVSGRVLNNSPFTVGTGDSMWANGRYELV